MVLPRHLFRFRVSDLRAGMLLLAIIVYGGFGSPTPQGFGWPELATGILLVLAVGPEGLAAAISGVRWWQRAGSMLLLYGLTVPVVIGAARGHDGQLILRDVIPFLFLLLPLFLAGGGTRYRLAVTVACGVAGVAFALRLLIPAFIAAHHVGFSALPDADPERLANAPTVLFAAIMAFACAGGLIMQTWRPTRLALGALLFGGGVIAVLAMMAAVQRASLGLMAMILAALWLKVFIKHPLRALPVLLPVAVMVLAYHVQLTALAEHLAMKTATVGFNNRPQEAEVVFGLVGRNLWDALFGLGWGQTLTDPAVGGATVNYTHTLGTALWLKGGFAGVILAALYLGSFAVMLARLVLRHPALGLALAAPFAIDITLYASYKSLDFGLILTLIALWDGGFLRDGAAQAMPDEAQPLKFEPHAG